MSGDQQSRGGGPLPLGIVGLGKIAQDQHLPAIAANPAFRLAAVTSQRGLNAEGAKTFMTSREMLDGVPDLAAVAVCTPPQARYAICREAIKAGKHVLLEKPPTATLSELADLADLADARGVTLFTTWHAQHNPAVDEARRQLAGQTIRRLHVTWKEDVRHWHPGQDWIWEAGGFGVFDPGINALSILTWILPMPIFIQSADLEFPANKDAPIAATLAFSAGQDGDDLVAEFDWRQTGPQSWDIEVETGEGAKLRLSNGGKRLEIDGVLVTDAPSEEYSLIYARFAELIEAGSSEVHVEPFRLVADAFMVGRRTSVPNFES